MNTVSIALAWVDLLATLPCPLLAAGLAALAAQITAMRLIREME